MGERDDRIESLKRAEGGARSQLGGVERNYENERNATVTDASRDADIAALTSQRNALQEQLAKVQGELSELERGRDAEQKAALGRDGQPSQQPVAPPDQKRPDGAPQPDAANPALAQEPAATTQPNPNSQPAQAREPDRDVSDAAQQPASQSRSGNAVAKEGSDRSDDTQTHERDKGFGPFEKSDTAPYGFDPKDISKEPVNFQRVEPGEAFLWGQPKSPTSDFKPYSQVLSNGQAADLDALAKSIRSEDATARRESADLGLDQKGREEFDRAQFEFGVQKMNQMFADQDRQRDQFGSNSLVDPNQSVVDREMELKRWDVTRGMCRDQADRELRPTFETKLADERQKLEDKDAKFISLNEQRLRGQQDAEQRQQQYESMLASQREKDLEPFRKENEKQFTVAVENRADTLQAQHFPEVHGNGPAQYVPPAPARTVGNDNGPGAGPPPPAM